MNCNAVGFSAQSLGLHTLHSYLDAVEFNSSHGINFATAGSTIRRPNTTGFSPFSLDVQFSQYSQFRTRYKAAAKEGIFHLFYNLLMKVFVTDQKKLLIMSERINKLGPPMKW